MLMLLKRKPLIVILVAIALFIVAFFVLIRGCLSQYNERSAIAPALYFEKDGKAVIFSVVKFDKTTSYSQKGGFVSKSVSTSYFIQNNDALSGQKLLDKKIGHHSDIKYYPVEVMGAAKGVAWVFMGELMAFDPFTLEKIADVKTLREKNPSLKDKLPAERRFYVFDRNEETIAVTAADGSQWKLNTATFLMTADEEADKEEGESKEVTQLKKWMKQNQAAQDSLMDQKLRKPSRMLAAQEITTQQYRKMIEGFNEERTKLYDVRDSLQSLLSKAEKKQRSGNDISRKIELLQSRTGIHFGQVKANMDTINGKWYGLYTKQEMEKLWNRFQNQSAYGETARRQLLIAGYSPDKYDDIVFDKENAGIVNSSSFFLDGGFLLNKNTGTPIRLSPASFLIVHKDIIGNEGKIQASRVATDGKTVWTFNTGLKEWADWILTDKHLIVLGTDNKELSGGEVNVLLCIDHATGKAVRYDYFKDK